MVHCRTCGLGFWRTTLLIPLLTAAPPIFLTPPSCPLVIFYPPVARPPTTLHLGELGFKMVGSRRTDASWCSPTPAAATLAEAATPVAAAAVVAASPRRAYHAPESSPVAAAAAVQSIVPAADAAAAALAASAARAAAATLSVSESPSDPAATALAAAAAVGRAAGLSSSVAVGSAVVAAAALRRRGARSSAGRAETVGELEQSLHRTVDTWVDRGTPRVTSTAYMPPVPLHELQSAATTRQTLPQLFAERTIPFGEEDSAQSLKASLSRFNATGTTVWGARMHSLAVFVRTKGKHNFFSSMEHGFDVGVDRAAAGAAVAPSTPARLPAPARRSPSSHSPATPLLDAKDRDEDPGPAHLSATPASRPRSPAHPQESAGSPLDSSTVVDTPSALKPQDAPLPASLLPSSQHAAMMLQSMAVEQDERVRSLAKSAQVTEVKEMVYRMNKCIQANAQSAAA
ncbi:hypothetical protein BU14_0084s0038 [Porphyra umbilicalis]|uniref:Uncharacterized protein n=1 Tax=Porphyra umbilicalis TaxID=2786 RepID=A0A1X6PEQ1_PORUM|nr:hypothetical protein BU14_0084s0038 [Porphyra umbilicalis]|eukprot:OSX79225.1 hypothetical protein BU14_0084s0038 [Porphyra umbilicalis]